MVSAKAPRFYRFSGFRFHLYAEMEQPLAIETDGFILSFQNEKSGYIILQGMDIGGYHFQVI